ncbi:D-glycero-beta-D-manno-heptose 1-phosphate adenylyltransferase [Actinomycetes bacterium KLBMP 9797]
MATESGRLLTALDAWGGTPVLVVGDVMLDEWRFADAGRLSREAPAPVLTLRRRDQAAGGAGNAAANLAALGARPALVAPLGDDDAADQVAACLAGDGVTDRTIRVPDRGTPIKRRLLAGGQIVVREDEGDAGGPLPDGGARRVIEALAAADQPVLVVADYGLGALPEPVRRWLIAHRDRFGTVALDAHDLAPWRDLAPTVLAPSIGEAARALARPAAKDAAGEYAAALRDRFGADVVAVTLDGDGAVVASADGVRRTRTAPAPEGHTVGAGDAYLAALTLALATGAPVAVAADLAQAAAAVTVARTGTCVCDLAALRAALTAEATIVDADALERVVRHRRAAGDRVVFTNGCFDVLHRGHVSYLRQARELGDLLVVAVNSDASVRRLKGPDRPVVPAEDRVAVLAALSCVDHVVVFEEDSPAGLIERVRPDLYVKGGDYPPELVPEAAVVRRLGGEVRILDYVPDRSTSAIIERIRAQPRSQPAR